MNQSGSSNALTISADNRAIEVLQQQVTESYLKEEEVEQMHKKEMDDLMKKYEVMIAINN